MLDAELIQTFVTEYHAELQRHQKDRKRRQRAIVRERADLEGKIARLVDAIADGKAGEIASVTAKLRELEGRLKQLPPEPEADEISIVM